MYSGSSDGHYINFCPAQDPATVIALFTLNFPVREKGKECLAERRAGTCLQREGVKTTHIQTGNKKGKQGLLVYSVRERRVKGTHITAIRERYTQLRGRQGEGMREGGLCTGG
jgi:hypothetical protein